MGRKKIGVAQQHFHFAITPMNDADWRVVERLRAMQNSNGFSAWVKRVIYEALDNDDKRSIDMRKPDISMFPLDKPAQPKNTWIGNPTPKPK